MSTPTTTTPSRPVLGIYVSSQSLEAVLLRPTGDRPKVVRRFSRPRFRSGMLEGTEDYASVLPGLQSSEDIDFTLEVGDTETAPSSPNQPDLDDELDSSSGEMEDAAEAAPHLFAPQLREILNECADLGVPNPEIAFCAGPPDTDMVEIEDLEEASLRSNGWWNAVRDQVPFGEDPEQRRRLHAVRDRYSRSFDGSRAVFLPMTPDESGTARLLATFPTDQESITPTLKTLSETDDVDATVGRLDAEISLYINLIRHYVTPSADETTAIVRVGVDDTLLLFMTGNEVRRADRLHSLTTYDAPNTIGSRILLYQDDQKIESVDRVVIVAERDDDRLMNVLASLYPEAEVAPLTHTLSPEWINTSGEDLQGLRSESGPALGAALLLFDGLAGDTNLLGSTPRRTTRRTPAFAWHTVTMFLILAAVTLSFTWHYVDQQATIDRLEAQAQKNPVSGPDLSPEMLRHRIDSLYAVHEQHSRALHVLDSLLVGSTEWSTTMERTAILTRTVGDVWLEEWSIDPSTITLKGTALDRGNLAEFTRRLDGTVYTLSYAEISDRRVYPFRIEIPRVTELPEAAVRLRENFGEVTSASLTSPPSSP